MRNIMSKLINVNQDKLVVVVCAAGFVVCLVAGVF